MTTLRVALSRFAGLFVARRRDEDLADEVQAHLDLLAEENRRRGMSSTDARAAARREFGGVEQMKERHRRQAVVVWLDDAWRDVHSAIRLLAKHKRFAAIAVLSLSFGVGTTAAVYKTVDWLINRSPGAVVEPERLVLLTASDRDRPQLGSLNFTYNQFLDLRNVQDAFVDVAEYGKLPAILSHETWAEQVVRENVSGNYFSVLGTRPVLGRAITPDDDLQGAPPVAMLSYDFWQSRYAGDPAVLDRSIRLNGVLTRIIGVVPREFEGYHLDWNAPSNVWTAGRPQNVDAPFYVVVGRLRPDVTVERARQMAQQWVPSLRPAALGGGYRTTTIDVTPGSEQRIGGRERARSFLGILLIVCALILAAACFNVINLLLGRLTSRRTELAMRAAIGANRLRLFRQLLTEAMLLGAAAAIAGAGVAVVTARLLAPLPRVYLNLPYTARSLTTEGSMDIWLLGGACALGILSAFIFGTLPAWRASVRNPLVDLAGDRSGWTWSGKRVTTRQIVLTIQVSVSVVLAVTAGLYARSLWSIAWVETGLVEPNSVLVARILPPRTNLSRERGDLFWRGLFDRLQEHPQVVSAGVGWNPPFYVGRNWFSKPGEQGSVLEAGMTSASPGFFETQGISVVAGHEFTTDSPSDALVINTAMATAFWPNQDAIGQTLLMDQGNTKELRRIIGVVSERNCRSLLGEALPCAWTVFPMGSSSGYMRIRTRVEPMQFVATLRTMVHDLNPDIAVAEEATLAAFVRDLTGRQRLSAAIAMGLALFAIVLLIIGCVSLFVSMVKDSAREIAIRIALGVNPRRLASRIIGQGLVLLVAGSALGVVAARSIAQGVADQLYQTTPTDLATFVSVPALIVLTGVASVSVAAVIATRTEPTKYLKDQ